MAHVPYSANQRARSPPILAILNQNKGNYCRIIINFLLSLTNQFINRIVTIGELELLNNF